MIGRLPDVVQTEPISPERARRFAEANELNILPEYADASTWLLCRVQAGVLRNVYGDVGPLVAEKGERLARMAERVRLGDPARRNADFAAKVLTARGGLRAVILRGPSGQLYVGDGNKRVLNACLHGERWIEAILVSVPEDWRTEHLTRLATRFRDAIVAMDRRDLPTMEQFPAGACGDAAPLLGQFLLDQGEGEWTYVSGEREGAWSHAWIEQDGWIVDITADQFPDMDQPVIVTLDRSWHAQFGPLDADHPALIDTYDKRTKATLGAMYEAALGKLAVGL